MRENSFLIFLTFVPFPPLPSTPTPPILPFTQLTKNGQQHNIMFYMNASDIYSQFWYNLKGLRASGTMVSILQEVD